jgi:hypothetical protein
MHLQASDLLYVQRLWARASRIQGGERGREKECTDDSTRREADGVRAEKRNTKNHRMQVHLRLPKSRTGSHG